MSDSNQHWKYVLVIVAVIAIGVLFDYYVLEKPVGAAFCDSIIALIIMVFIVRWGSSKRGK